VASANGGVPLDVRALLTDPDFTGYRVNSWQVEFKLTTFRSESNSVIASLRNLEGSDQTNRLMRLRERMASGTMFSDREETREGTLLCSGSQVRLENKLLRCSSPPKKGQIFLGDTLIVITQDACISKLSYATDPSEPHKYEAVPGDVEITSNDPNNRYDALLLPPVILRGEFSAFLSSLMNTSIETGVVDGSPEYEIKGIRVKGECATEWTFYFAGHDQVLPKRIVATDECTPEMGVYTIESTNHPVLGQVPLHVDFVATASGLRTFSQSWDFFNYKVEPAMTKATWEVPIPLNAIVNESRFTNAFAYFMGLRPPTRDELKAMSMDSNAIVKYERDSHMPPPIVGAVHWRNGFARSVLFCAAVLPLLYFVLRAVHQQRAASQTSETENR
jgi:hypothetical protein